MAAKPASEPRWANVGGAITVPSSGKQDVGFVVAEKPAAQHFNWYMNLVYQWVRYLADAAFTGALSCTGAFTALSGAFTNAVTAASAAITGLLSGGQVQTAEADIRHGTRTDVHNPCEATALSNWTPTILSNFAVLRLAAATSGSGFFAIPGLSVGDRLLSVRVICASGNGAAGDVTGTLVKQVAAPGVTPASVVPTTIVTLQSSTATTNLQTLTFTPTADTVAADELFGIQFSGANTAGGSKTLYRIEVDYDRP